jgi:hypothetical protein
LLGLLALLSRRFLFDYLIFAHLDSCKEACSNLEDIIDQAVAGLFVKHDQV